MTNYGNATIKNANIHYNYIIPIAGDVSRNGEVAVEDVIYALKYVVEDIELDDTQFKCADVNNNDEITVLDAILIQKIILDAN